MTIEEFFEMIKEPVENNFSISDNKVELNDNVLKGYAIKYRYLFRQDRNYMFINEIWDKSSKLGTFYSLYVFQPYCKTMFSEKHLAKYLLEYAL